MIDTEAMPFLADIPRVQAQMRPNDTAFWFEGETTTYQDLDTYSSQVANGLIGAGIEPDDRVGYLAKNTSQYYEMLFGAAKAPATAQRFTREWLHDPHALASGLILEVEDTRHGTMRQMGNVAWLADDETAAQKSSAVQADLAALLAEPQRGGVAGHRQLPRRQLVAGLGGLAAQALGQAGARTSTG